MSGAEAEKGAAKLSESPREEAQSARDEPVEARLTAHAIIAGLGPGPAGLEVLHKDLYDSRREVVLSALWSLAAIANPASLRFVARFVGSSDRQIRLEAVRALGSFSGGGVAKLLSDVYKTAQDDELRCDTLRALVKVVPSNPKVLHVLEERALSPLSSPELRSCCAILLVSSSGGGRVAEILTSAQRNTVDAVLSWAAEHPEVSVPILDFGKDRYPRLASPNRRALVEIAASSSGSVAQEMILRGLDDEDSEVRSASYRALSRGSLDPAYAPAAVERLVGRSEPATPLEEEALAAIDRLEEQTREKGGIESSIVAKIERRSRELYGYISANHARVGSETIELGWLILRSREYLEYYGNEEFRQALVHYLKGGIYYSADQLLVMLKKTAERVEVKHFEGYRALADIIRNPKRPGTALIVRELNIAKLDKREPFLRLIRNLRLMRLARTLGKDSLAFVRAVFSWARGEQLYRIAEAALYVLAKFDSNATTAVCRDLLTPPIQSKILAIASIRLLGDLGYAELESTLESLLRSGTDAHILLHLIDSLTARRPNSLGAIAPMVALVRGAEDIEIARHASLFLSAQPVSNLFETLTDGFEHLDDRHQEVILDLLSRTLDEIKARNPEGVAEFLYRILREQGNRVRGQATVLLWRLGDDFAPKVLARSLKDGDIESRIEVVRSLKGHVDEVVARELLALAKLPAAPLQEALRETLLAVEERTTAAFIVDSLSGRATEDSDSDGGGADALGSSAQEVAGLESGIFREKQAFRFEQEYIRDLAVLFTDIKGYSAMASKLSTMQVTALIRDYEATLIPTMANHRGFLVKRMGDGHMFVFESALDACLAALRFQKSLKRFNSYREESTRVVVRVGIHWGQVVRRDGDFIGNNVNIASRLESSAKGGSILVSEALYERLDGKIHARELGEITVKNIAEPIKVYEPYEIQIDLPAELDPLKAASPGPSDAKERDPNKGASVQTSPPQPVAAAAILERIELLFSTLDELCRKVEKGEAPVSQIRIELEKGLKEIRSVAGGPPPSPR